ncbi:MAG: FprA family A-type flavoprotein [Lachnospiraceae bacterium]|nr:FprA family A-type flavoprotein [Lachnospiraceae bacterium]
MDHITDKIINIGVDDGNITLFENQYHLPDGMAYNSYLIMDEKVCLMDGVDADVKDKWLGNMDEALAGRSIDYIVVQHMEPDHSGALEAVFEKFPEATVCISVGGAKMLGQFFDKDYSSRLRLIKEGDTLDLGGRQLKFIAAPMVHWPEVMMTYDAKDKVLFSADGFGKFGVKGAEADDWACEARRYYFNIVGKYGPQVAAVLRKAAALDIEHICSLHGPILPENEPLDFYIKKYDIWSKYEPEDDGVTIAYASIHGTGTKQAAEALATIFEEKGVKVGLQDLANDDIHEAVEDAFRYPKLVLCASTYDADIFPPMRQFINLLAVKAYQKRRIAFVENGSWAPMAAKLMRAAAEGFKDCTFVEKSVTIKSALKSADIEALRALAEEL